MNEEKREMSEKKEKNETCAHHRSEEHQPAVVGRKGRQKPKQRDYTHRDHEARLSTELVGQGTQEKGAHQLASEHG